jgi:DNA-binding NtrC family response regulator
VLVNHFVHTYAVKLGKRIETIPQAVINAWQAHHWPGNVRELAHVIERAVILAQGASLPLDDFLTTRRDVETPAGAPLTFAAVERQHIKAVLQATRWTIEGQGGRLGVRGFISAHCAPACDSSASYGRSTLGKLVRPHDRP